jgi:pyrimidine-nucleoside phosphorylase
VRETELTALVSAKRAGAQHSRLQIESLVAEYCAGGIDDDSFAHWLRAVVEAGLTDGETIALTRAMALSGATIDWSDTASAVVDKHSTGGVGDGVSLIAVPLAAAAGVKVAKLSGRALAHTGGTIDKLECVPGLRTDLSVTAFKRQVIEVGCAIAHASDALAPADKKIYALRNRTQTVDSIGLIAASVLSKKIAAGAQRLVIDVKCGRCAFMKTHARARELARVLLEVGSRLGRDMTVLITDMESPLGSSVGDALELDEAIGVLRGGEGSRLREVALAVAEAMLAGQRSGQSANAAQRRDALEYSLADGTAYQRFVAMLSAQGGDLAAFARPGAPALSVAADAAGFIASVDGLAIAQAVASLGGVQEKIDRSHVGVRLRKREGDAVRRGEATLDVFAPNEEMAKRIAHSVATAVRVGSQPPAQSPAIIERVHAAPAR